MIWGIELVSVLIDFRVFAVKLMINYWSDNVLKGQIEGPRVLKWLKTLQWRERRLSLLGKKIILKQIHILSVKFLWIISRTWYLAINPPLNFFLKHPTSLNSPKPFHLTSAKHLYLAKFTYPNKFCQKPGQRPIELNNFHVSIIYK